MLNHSVQQPGAKHSRLDSTVACRKLDISKRLWCFVAAYECGLGSGSPKLSCIQLTRGESCTLLVNQFNCFLSCMSHVMTTVFLVNLTAQPCHDDRSDLRNRLEGSLVCAQMYKSFKKEERKSILPV